jgi:hypothetical protein
LYNINLKNMARSKATEKIKTKPTAGSAKSKAEAKTPRAKKSAKSLPTEDEIRKKAQEIYNERVSKGEHGTAEEDWIKAEKFLKG